MAKLLLIVVVVVSLSVASTAAAAAGMRSALAKSLFDGYDARSPPDGIVELQFGLTVINMDLCPRRQALDVKGWMEMIWTDDRLTWNESKWTDIDSLRVPRNRIWIPDVTVYDGVDRLNEFMPDKTSNAIVYSDGRIVFVPAVGFKSSCQVDFDNYPFGMQNCTLKFGSWTRDVSLINIVPSARGAALDFQYMPTNMIEIKDSSVKEVTKTYNCCPDQKYKHLAFNIIFDRKANIYHDGMAVF